MSKEINYLQAFEQMLLIRRFEERCAHAYSTSLIGGFCHLYIGQEAVAVGVNLAKSKGDSTITSYRCHAHSVLSGLEPKDVFAELMGRASGSSKGKGGSMHIFNKEGNFFGGHGIVGAQVPIGTGIALKFKYQNLSNICYTFLGDGAANQGQTFEAFNMAALWKLPVVYIIENNGYSMGTSVKRSTFVTELYRRGESLGIPGKLVDGMDFIAVYNAVLEASNMVRAGSGPLILEMETYRYRGHSMSDPAKYRTKEEVDKYKSLDPIDVLRSFILSNKYASEEEIKKIEKHIKTTIQNDFDFAQNETAPEEQELFCNVIQGW